MHVYERIANYIRETGLKQCVLATKLGYSESQLSAMLNGKRKIYAEDLIKFCNVLKKNPNDFLLVSD